MKKIGSGLFILLAVVMFSLLSVSCLAQNLQEKDIQETYYTVVFDTSGLATIAQQTVKEGEKVERPQDPEEVMDGDTVYQFIGWYLGEKKYDFDTAINCNVIIKAKWNTKTYSVDIPICR